MDVRKDGGIIGPDAFERLVAAITGDTPLPDAVFLALAEACADHACASELDVIWHLAGTLKPPSAAGSE